jgi:hypothetical protein
LPGKLLPVKWSAEYIKPVFTCNIYLKDFDLLKSKPVLDQRNMLRQLADPLKILRGQQLALTPSGEIVIF